MTPIPNRMVVQISVRTTKHDSLTPKTPDYQYHVIRRHVPLSAPQSPSRRLTQIFKFSNRILQPSSALHSIETSHTTIWIPYVDRRIIPCSKSCFRFLQFNKILFAVMADTKANPLGHRNTKMRDMLISMSITSIPRPPSRNQSFHWSVLWQVLDGRRITAAKFKTWDGRKWPSKHVFYCV